MERLLVHARRLGHIRPMLIAVVLGSIAIAVAGVSVAAQPNPFRWG